MLNSVNKNTLAREYAFKFLYHFQFSQFEKELSELSNGPVLTENLDQFDESYSEQDSEHPDNIISTDIRAKAEVIIKTVVAKRAEIEEKILAVLDVKNISRLKKVDLTILNLGVSELLFLENAPEKVVINESINLAKKYGSNESASLINGLLDKILKSNK